MVCQAASDQGRAQAEGVQNEWRAGECQKNASAVEWESEPSSSQHTSGLECCEREEGGGEQAAGDGCDHEVMQSVTQRLQALAWSAGARDALVRSETSGLCLFEEDQPCDVGEQVIGEAF